MIYYELVVKYKAEESPRDLPFGEANPVAEMIESQFKSFNERHYIKESGIQMELIYSYDENRIFIAFSRGR